MTEDKLNLTVVAAHAIDEAKCIGGTFAKYSAMGHGVHTVIVTKLDDEMKECVRKASAVLGGDTTFLQITHEDLQGGMKDLEIIKKIADVLRETKADIVFSHIPDDPSYGSYAHANVGRLTEAASSQARRGGQVKLLLQFISNMWTPEHLGRKPDLFIDISDTVKTKWEAMKQYTRWVREPEPRMLCENRMAASRMYGVVSGCLYAEAFFRPFDRHPYGRIALDAIPHEWLTRRGDDWLGPEELTLPKEFLDW